MDLSTRQMRAFLALRELRSFTRAAAVVHLSQPAFSAMMRALEETIGHQLILRSPRGIHLTPAGERFAAMALAIVRDFDTGVRSLHESLDPRNQVSLAAMVALTYQWLPPILAGLRESSPEIQVELFAVFPRDCLTLIETNRAEIAVTAVGSVPTGITTEILWRDPFHVVCRVDHPLAEKVSVALDDLLAYPFVHYTESTLARRQIDAALQPNRLRVVCETEHIHTIKALVEAGVGIGMATEMNRGIFQSEMLTMRPISGAGVSRDIALASRTGQALSSAALKLVSMMRASVPRLAEA